MLNNCATAFKRYCCCCKKPESHETIADMSGSYMPLGATGREISISSEGTSRTELSTMRRGYLAFSPQAKTMVQQTIYSDRAELAQKELDEARAKLARLATTSPQQKTTGLGLFK